MPDDTPPADPPAPPDPRPAINWNKAVAGLAMLAVAVASVFVVETYPALGQDGPISLTVLRIVTIVLLAIGATITLGAFFAIDIKATFKLPFLKDGSAQAVGGLIVAAVLGYAFHTLLPPFVKPEAPPDPVAELKELIADQERIALDKLAADYAIIDRKQLIRDLFYDEANPLRLRTELVVTTQPIHPGLDKAAMIEEAHAAGIGGIWRDRHEVGSGRQLESIRPSDPGGVAHKAYYILEGQERHAGVTFVELDPDTLDLRLMMLFSGRSFCEVGAPTAFADVGADISSRDKE